MLLQVYPEKGTVSFSAGLHGWAFTLTSFAKIYASKFGVEVPPSTWPAAPAVPGLLWSHAQPGHACWLGPFAALVHKQVPAGEEARRRAHS